MADDDNKDLDFGVIADDTWEAQAGADDQQIERLLSGAATEGGIGIDLEDDTPFDQTNKAADAQDFEDISDDDLPDEEPTGPSSSYDVPGLTDDGGTNDDDDLFGEHGASSPLGGIFGPPSPADAIADQHDGELNVAINGGGDDDDATVGALNFDPEPALNNQDPDIPEAAESKEDLLKAAWPTFQRGVVIKWSEMLPNKKADWKPKKPARKPRALITTKLSLELDVDQEKLFRIPGPAAPRRKDRLRDAEERGLVWCGQCESDDEDDGQEFDIDHNSDDELVGGFSLRDIEMTCVDWADTIEDNVRLAEEEQEARRLADEADSAAAAKRPRTEEEDEWDAEFMTDDLAPAALPVRKKRPRVIPQGLPRLVHYNTPSFDSFEAVTKRAAKRVRLDTNDPHLFLDRDNADRVVKRPRVEQRSRRMANGCMGCDIMSRFNRSNDEAYEALKENHQSKVRATLGNIGVEHAMPALKLTWPYYNVRFDQNAESYHRPRLHTEKFTGLPITFEPLRTQKRKQMRGKAPDVFQTTKDLVLSDNSTAVLFEYCERVPRVLSKFGMGNRLVHYYRRTGPDDQTTQKHELGEANVLLPEDRSPFSIFGTVAPGETVPTLHNEMYRAPVFKHSPRETDFLCGRSSTGAEGSSWYLRKIDHLYVVGQTFPLVEVPGPHSRKVTNVTKNRMKQLAYRLIRKDPNHRLQLSDITAHIIDSTDTQNRQKLKDFLAYEKRQNNEGKGLWKLKEGEAVPETPAIRTMIKPMDVSLIEAMQLGVTELQDAGYDVRNVKFDEEEQDDDHAQNNDAATAAGSAAAAAAAAAKKGEQDETLANKMAPWKTSKAFIDACAGKAMLQLHGEGDPTGHGLGYSFIRTSMKGGYLEAVQGPLATSADAMEKEKRAYGGHAYNVKKQEAMYREGISEIWQKQQVSLANATEHADDDIQAVPDDDERFGASGVSMNASMTGGAATAATPVTHHFDEGMSQFSGFTSSSRHARKSLEIFRHYAGEEQPRRVVISDPVVINQYLKRRSENDADRKDIYTLKPTGNTDQDRHEHARVQKELQRLVKNRARRQARDQQKQMQRMGSLGVGVGGGPPSTPMSSSFLPMGTAMSPEPAGTPDPSSSSAAAAAAAAAADGARHGNKSFGAGGTPSAGTSRKCAKCGMVGHIKTNKKLCPLLNGTIKPDESRADHGGFGAFNVSTPGPATTTGGVSIAGSPPPPPQTPTPFQ